jgi:hypothetical protein
MVKGKSDIKYNGYILGINLLKTKR